MICSSFAELYHFKMEARDLGGATSVVRQMMQQHPDELEPIYYGMQLSILSSQNSAYQQFRSAAISKKMPATLILLLDFAFVVLTGEQTDMIACLEDIKKKMAGKNHYLTLIEYTVHDIFSDDDKRVKTARKAFLDSLDQYLLKTDWDEGRNRTLKKRFKDSSFSARDVWRRDWWRR